MLGVGSGLTLMFSEGPECWVTVLYVGQGFVLLDKASFVGSEFCMFGLGP